MAVARAFLSGGEGAKGSAAADRYQVVVHVDESALRGGAGRSDLPIETVKRLCCDGSVITVDEDARGNPLNIGRKRRTLTTALRRALWSRDRGCVFPNCHRKRYVDGHHLKHWTNGGETSLDNTALLCTFHHVLVQDGGFGMWRDETGEFCFRRPDGRVIPRGGYRLEDMVDDVSTDDGRAAAVAGHAGVSVSALPDASAEVREPRAVYGIARRAMPRIAHDQRVPDWPSAAR